MPLLRSAKTAVSAEAQADACQLAAVYVDMASQLSAKGLNLPAIEAQRYTSPSDHPSHACACACACTLLADVASHVPTHACWCIPCGSNLTVHARVLGQLRPALCNAALAWAVILTLNS